MESNKTFLALFEVSFRCSIHRSFSKTVNRGKGLGCRYANLLKHYLSNLDQGQSLRAPPLPGPLAKRRQAPAPFTMTKSRHCQCATGNSNEAPTSAARRLSVIGQENRYKRKKTRKRLVDLRLCFWTALHSYGSEGLMSTQVAVQVQLEVQQLCLAIIPWAWAGSQIMYMRKQRPG